MGSHMTSSEDAVCGVCTVWRICINNCAVFVQCGESVSITKHHHLKKKKKKKKRKRNNTAQPMPKELSPFLTGRMFLCPNILRTLRRTMIRFLTELLLCRIWFGQSKLYFILNWLVMRCKLRPELAADVQQTAWSKMLAKVKSGQDNIL